MNGAQSIKINFKNSHLQSGTKNKSMVVVANRLVTQNNDLP